MPPFRNPFGRRPPAVNNTAPGQDDGAEAVVPNGVENRNRNGLTPSRTSSALSIKPNKEEPNEFKLSVVNDSGVYLPPSPPDKKSFWRRTPTSTTSSSYRSALSENEPFSISRESFDSYRRSFDISARSPISYTDGHQSQRQSLDSRSPRTPRSAINSAGRFERPQPTDEEGFEEVGLNDDTKPKRRSIFSRFGDSVDSPSSEEVSRPSSSHRGFHLPGRKRGQSGQGAELGNIPKPAPKEPDDEVIR